MYKDPKTFPSSLKHLEKLIKTCTVATHTGCYSNFKEIVNFLFFFRIQAFKLGIWDPPRVVEGLVCRENL